MQEDKTSPRRSRSYIDNESLANNPGDFAEKGKFGRSYLDLDISDHDLDNEDRFDSDDDPVEARVNK